MYFAYRGFGAGGDQGWQGGHCVVGATGAASDLFFAEGYTGDNFHTWLCLQNPGDTDAVVELTFLTQEAGALAPVGVAVPAHSRMTVRANDLAGPGYQLSTLLHVVSGPPVMAERPIYFAWGPAAGTAATTRPGAPLARPASRRWTTSPTSYRMLICRRWATPVSTWW